MSTKRPGEELDPEWQPWRRRLHEIIFEADTPAGKLFDVLLLASIVLSVLAVCFESMAGVRESWGLELRVAEWLFTVFFTIEYVLRLAAVRKPLNYAFSFFGIVDLLSVLPTYLTLFFPEGQAHALIVIRALRLLRIFRIFKIARYVTEVSRMVAAFRATVAKIAVFLLTILTIVLIMGALMYVVEGETSGFTSIPRGVYWAIVTVTTVGYGDIAPATPLGQALAAAAMVIGYSLIIIPTGIFAAEMAHAKRVITTQSCPDCLREGHDADAAYCKHCGSRL